MGIKYFSTFLNFYPIELLSSVDVGDEFLLIDGSEILYELYGDAIKDGRANYVEFRDHVKKFFETLQECKIKPIVITDGFKYEENTDYYIEARKLKITEMANVISGSEPGNRSIRKRPLNKAFLSSNAFKQTAQEMNIPWFCAKRNTEEDLAGLSRLLNAPVLADNTTFCSYHLDAGCIPISRFHWKTPKNTNGRKVIKAQKFQINDFSHRFGVTPEALGFLAVLFPQRNFDRFENFRDANFKGVAIPPHLRNLSKNKYRRPNIIENFLIWFSNAIDISKYDMVERIINSLEVEPQKAKEIRSKILKDLGRYEEPKLKKNLLQSMLENIDDPECQTILEAGLDGTEEDDEVIHSQVANFQKAYSSGDFPDWARLLLTNRASGKPLVNFLPLILTNPETHQSPHRATTGIRKVVYQVLFRDVQQSLSIKEYDRVGFDYVPQSFEIERFPGDLDKNDSISARRRFVINTLIEDEERCDEYCDEIESLNDDMQLTMAVTILWSAKCFPSSSMMKGMAFLFSLMEIKQQNLSMKSTIDNIVQNMVRRARIVEMDLDVLQWISQWEVCLAEAITLNKLLRFPFPEPTIGKFFSALILEAAYKEMNSGSDIEKIIKSICGFPELYRKACDILFS